MAFVRPFIAIHTVKLFRGFVILAGEVTTMVGGSQGFVDGVGKKAKFYHPTGLSLDVHSGILYVADHVSK